MKNLEESLKILEHIHRNPQATQREIVQSLNISLGKVNFLIKSLAKMGLVKLEKFKKSSNKRGYIYIITSRGIKEKVVITKKFLERKLLEYDDIRDEIERLRIEIDKSAQDKRQR